jgi:hypothetical protein
MSKLSKNLKRPEKQMKLNTNTRQQDLYLNLGEEILSLNFPREEILETFKVTKLLPIWPETML